MNIFNEWNKLNAKKENYEKIIFDNEWSYFDALFLDGGV